MNQRRQFLGSLAAICVASGTGSLFAASQARQELINDRKLQWHSQVIETVPHNRALRHPVVTAVSIQPGGNLLAIVGDDHFVCLYDMTQNRFTYHTHTHTDWVRAAKFSPSGQELVSAGNDRTLQVWSVGSWKQPTTVKRHPEAIIEIAFSNDGSKLATVGFEKTLRVYNMGSKVQQQELECPSADNHAVAFSSDDTLLAAGGRCGNIRVWDTKSWKQVSQFKAHRKRIRSIDFTTDGQVVSASDDQTVRLTDPINTRNTTQLPRISSKLYSTVLMNNGMLATGGSDNQIHIWDTKGLNKIGSLHGHTGTVSNLDYANGKLVSGSYDTTVRLWTTENHTSAPGQRHTQLRQGWNRKMK